MVEVTFDIHNLADWAQEHPQLAAKFIALEDRFLAAANSHDRGSILLEAVVALDETMVEAWFRSALVEAVARKLFDERYQPSQI
jgi:hypothetical protein